MYEDEVCVRCLLSLSVRVRILEFIDTLKTLRTRDD